MLWGRHDKTFSLEHGQDLALKLEDATMLVLDDAGHLPFEDAPKPFADAVGAFLRAP